MNQRSDTDQLLRHWMSDGPSTMPDRVLDVVADRIARQPQRGWRLRGRSTMPAAFKYGVAAAAVLVVALVGYSLLPKGPSTGVPGPTSTLAATPTTGPSATAAAAPIECEDGLEGCSGMLVGGPHRSSNLVPQLAFATTGGIWANVIDLADLYKIDKVSDPTPGYPYIIAWTNASIADQSSACSTDPDPSRGRTAADWIDLVTTHPGLVATEPVDVSLGGNTARQVELVVASGWTQTCPNHTGPYVTLLVQRVGDQTAEYGVPSDERLLLTVVDVGARTAVILSYGPTDPPQFAAELGPIRSLIAKFRFTP